jgi:hypothetical protein
MFESVPQEVTVQPVRVQVTPASEGPPVTEAVKLAVLPGSIVSLAGPVKVIADGALAWPPQPSRLEESVRPRRTRAAASRRTL